jgi:hypothetical protein
MHAYYLYPLRYNGYKIRNPNETIRYDLDVNNDNVNDLLEMEAIAIFQNERGNAFRARVIGEDNLDKTYRLSIRNGHMRYDYIISTREQLRLNDPGRTWVNPIYSTDDVEILPNELYRYADVFMNRLVDLYHENSDVESEDEEEEEEDNRISGRRRKSKRGRKQGRKSRVKKQGRKSRGKK